MPIASVVVALAASLQRSEPTLCELLAPMVEYKSQLKIATTSPSFVGQDTTYYKTISIPCFADGKSCLSPSIFFIFTDQNHPVVWSPPQPWQMGHPQPSGQGSGAALWERGEWRPMVTWGNGRYTDESLHPGYRIPSCIIIHKRVGPGQIWNNPVELFRDVETSLPHTPQTTRPHAGVGCFSTCGRIISLCSNAETNHSVALPIRCSTNLSISFYVSIWIWYYVILHCVYSYTIIYIYILFL